MFCETKDASRLASVPLPGTHLIVEP